MRYSLLFLAFIALIYCKCNHGYYNAASAGEPEDCQPCMDHCGSCTSGDDCSYCDSSYYFDQDEKKCKKCSVEHCSYCPTATSCSSCDSYFFYNENDNSCKPCIDTHCQSCTATQCSYCEPSYYPDGNSCLRCSFEHCSNCNANSCTACDKFFYLDDNNNCKPCHDTCESCEGPDADQCKECRDVDHYLANGYCKKCEVEGCIAYGTNHRREVSSCNCVVCANGYSLKTSEDGPATCTKCNVEGCGECDASDPNKCKKCSPGTYMEDGKCKSCKKGCSCTKADECLSCIDGFYGDDNNECKACKKEGCVCSKSNPDACSRCVYGYVYDEDNEKCTKPKGNDAFGFNTFFTAFFCFALALIAVL